MGVTKGRSSGTWRVTVSPPGAKQIEKVVRGTEREAKEFYARLLIETNAKRITTRVSPSLRDFCTQVYAPHAVTHLSKSTWLQVRVYQVATLVKHLGEERLSDLGVLSVQRFKQVRTAEGARASSINNELRVLKTIMRHAIATGFPCSEPKWKRMPETGSDRVRAWSTAEMRALFDACAKVAPELHDVLVFLVNTGCRKGEALAAEWSWIDLDAGLIRIPVNEAWQPKSRRPREVPIPDVLRPILEGERKHHRWVFPSSLGDRYKRFPEALWRRARNEAGLTHGIHQLRHTFASHFLSKVPDLRLLGAIMGHTTQAMTERYTHFLPGHLERAKNVVQLGSLAGALAKARQPQQTGSEFASDTSSAGLKDAEIHGESAQVVAEKEPENPQRSDALWLNSGYSESDLRDELVGLRKALAFAGLDMAALERWEAEAS